MRLTTENAVNRLNEIAIRTSEQVTVIHSFFLSLYIFIISQLRLTSHPRNTVVLLDTGTPGTSREIFSEDADGETRTRNPSVINRVL